MRIEADRDRCVGAGQCVLAAPDLFDQSEEDGTVELLSAAPSPGQERVAREAEVACPAAAITLRE